jgi:hypothetical protein
VSPAHPLDIEALAQLVGTWATEARLPGREAVRGTTTFDWLDGGGYLIQRAAMDDPVFPRCVMVIGPAAGGGRVVQHYFDSRGVARVYEVGFEDGVLRLWRDFVEGDFAQRYSGRLSADGARIDGVWEACRDGETWEHDFALIYTRSA